MIFFMAMAFDRSDSLLPAFVSTEVPPQPQQPQGSLHEIYRNIEAAYKQGDGCSSAQDAGGQFDDADEQLEAGRARASPTAPDVLSHPYVCMARLGPL